MEETSQNLWLIDTSYNFVDSISFDYLLKHLKIVAITCVGTANNPTYIIKEKISKHISSIDEKLKIDIYEGSNKPFIDYEKEINDNKIINPYELMNNHEIQCEIKSEMISFENVAAVKILEISKKYGNSLNILSLGPLTNIAISVLIDKSIMENINSLVITGGSLNNWGNSGNAAEYNFRFDPIAAKNILKYFTKNKIVIPLEIERELSSKVFNNGIIQKLHNKSIAKKFQLVMDKKIELDKESEFSIVNFNTLSLFSSIYAINPKVISVKVEYPSDIDITGKLTRGILIMEKYDHVRSGKLSLTQFATSYNEDLLFEIIFNN